MPHLELAAFNPSSALLAISTGIARIELGADPSVGGVTPELSTFTQLSAGLKDAVPINIMVRPRGGGFLYNSSELSSIESSMSEFIAAGASVECGFVFGALTCTPSGMKVDEEICTSLIRLASGRRCIFHRAFDQIPRVDMEEELEVLIRCGFSAVLTSGCTSKAIEGEAMLQRLVERARGRIEIIVGGAVRSSNLEKLRTATGADWFHSSAITNGSELADSDEIVRMVSILKEENRGQVVR